VPQCRMILLPRRLQESQHQGEKAQEQQTQKPV